MAMLITTAAEAQRLLSPEYFATFCEENMISPKARLEDEVVAIDKLDLMRFGADGVAEQIMADINAMTGRLAKSPANVSY